MIGVAFLYYYAADSVALWFLLMPAALLAGLIALVAAVRRRRSAAGLGAGLVGLLAAAFAGWMIYALTVYLLTCAGVVDVASC
jgi:hypothetical protein